MNDSLLLYIFYGLVAGFSQYTPLSASAHQALFPMILRFNSVWPLLRFFVHLGALCGLVFLSWQRVTHIFREMKIVATHPKHRNRTPDVDAVLDARIVMAASIPALIGAVLTSFTAGMQNSLLLLAVMLVIGATAIYIPDYMPGGDRKTRGMSTLDGILFGLCAVCSAIPGVSAVGLMLFVGFLRKCDKGYILDIILMICGILLAGQVVTDLVSFVLSGFSGINIHNIIGCFVAAASSFGGSIGAIFMMRILIVKDGLSGFAYYGWGLGLFSLILYLMV